MDEDSGGDSRCRCGHLQTAHRHYRRGTDCALCLDCPRYRSANGRLRQLAAFFLFFRRSRSAAS